MDDLLAEIDEELPDAPEVEEEDEGEIGMTTVQKKVRPQ